MESIAPRIWRIGPSMVNSYLVEDGGALTIVDAGVPAYWQPLLDGLAQMGKSLADVRSVLLTHAHADHRGFAERARLAGVPVRVHELDAALARGEVGNSGSYGAPRRLLPIAKFLLFAAPRGLLRVPAIREVVTHGDGATLDVPGSPRVMHLPGHTAGMAALHFGGHDALFSGDAIVTYGFTTARTGPQLSPYNADRAAALDSLLRLDDVSASLVLPGHGAAWREGVQSAVAHARAAEQAVTVPAS